MSSLTWRKYTPVWRKRIAVWRNRLYLYPPADPLPHTRLFWLAMGLVTLLALLFAAYFILYLAARHNVYTTNAEDLGIMDQALWNTVHGHLFQQTICNTVNDTNCYSFAGISRFAIHFEPILFVVSLFYLVWPDPKTLQVIQVLVVASGAFPAFWLARLRLRSELAGVAIAALYLLYPAQQLAVESDFHAVTFTAAFLLFTLYFMYTRRTVWLFTFAVLAMACKEEIPLVIAFFGLWSILFQQRWRSGLALVVLASGWIGLAFLTIHFYSPTGHSLLTSRFSSLGNGPVEIARTVLLHPLFILKEHVLEFKHIYYLRTLLSPAGYLPLLAPWVLVLALPSLALNLLSSDANMYSGLYQYNAEILPALIFSTVEAIVLMLWVVQKLAQGAGRAEASSRPATPGRRQDGGTGAGKLTPLPSLRAPTNDDDVAPTWSQGPDPATPTWSQGLDPTTPLIPTRGITTYLAVWSRFGASAGSGRPRAHAPTNHGGAAPAWSRRTGQAETLPRRFGYWVYTGLFALLLCWPLFNVVRAEQAHGFLPFSQGFHWPQATSHTELAQRFIDMIPPEASVSAQSALVPHVSHRLSVYLFPYAGDHAEYIFLDVTSDIYPFFSASTYIHEVKKVLLSGDYGVVAAQDGYLLLKRGLPAPGVSADSPSLVGDTVLPNLPDSFCSFAYVSPQQVTNPLQVVFTSTADANALPGIPQAGDVKGPRPYTVNLIGAGVATPHTFSLHTSYMQITTFWRVSTPTTVPLQMQALITDKNGVEHFASSEFPAMSWCPTNTWKAGRVLRITSSAFFLSSSPIPTGLAHVSIALVPLTYQLHTGIDVQARLPLHIADAPSTVADSPGTNALQLTTVTLIP